MSRKAKNKKSFSDNALSVISAKRAGSPKAARAMGNIMAYNKNKDIPCHRVIKSNFCIGGFQAKSHDSWEKAGLLLKEGAIGIIPTDTIYGIAGTALKKEVVEKIYKLKKRDSKKPMIVLISSENELKKFGIKINKQKKKILKKFWPGRTSIILNCPRPEFSYLHRHTKTLAFRIPAKKELLQLLEISGPLVAPSANWEGFPFAQSINQAKKYFGSKVFYLNQGRIKAQPSDLIKISQNKVEFLRKS